MKHGGNTPATPAPETGDSGEQKPTSRGRKPKEEETPAPNPEDVEDAERRRLAILMVHGHRAAVKQMIPTLWGRRSRKPCPNA